MTPLSVPDRHLDLGCGKFPRNPYGRGALAGVDIRPLSSSDGFDYRTSNLSIAPIPFPASHFASVSAFDFLEHVPRLLVTPDGSSTFFPFVKLMDEIWRVLAPGGLFYAITPGFPSEEAFRDPTHVNYVSERTHEYFCGDQPLGRMYGFQGQFRAIRTRWVRYSAAYIREEVPTREQRWQSFKDKVRGRLSYLLWELEAVKPAT